MKENLINRVETFFPTQILYNLKRLHIDIRNYNCKNIQNNRDVKEYIPFEPMPFITS